FYYMIILSVDVPLSPPPSSTLFPYTTLFRSYGNRRTPEPVARDRPVTGVLEPSSELSVLDVVGHPVDLLVEFDHPVLELGDSDEPGGHRPVDQRIPAAPAVRVGVLVGFVSDQQRAAALERTGVVAQVLDDGLVRVEDLHSRVVGPGRVDASGVVDWTGGGDAVGAGQLLVLLAGGR